MMHRWLATVNVQTSLRSYPHVADKLRVTASSPASAARRAMVEGLRVLGSHVKRRRLEHITIKLVDLGPVTERDAVN